MYKLIVYLISNQVRFFTWYAIIVVGLIVWSYIEGVGDISGDLILPGPALVAQKFKAGYFTSLNYGIYYILFLPLFLRSVFACYTTAERLSNLPHDENTPISGSNEMQNKLVAIAIKNYSSKFIQFLKWRYSIFVALFFLIFFTVQNIIVERNDYQKVSLGWVQGLELKRLFQSKADTNTIKKLFI